MDTMNHITAPQLQDYHLIWTPKGLGYLCPATYVLLQYPDPQSDRNLTVQHKSPKKAAIRRDFGILSGTVSDMLKDIQSQHTNQRLL